MERPRTEIPLSLLAALAAGICWAGALSLLALGGLSPELPLFSELRLLYYGLVLGAAILTFTPIEWSMRLKGLAVEGGVGVTLLLYAVAFVPPPTAWLLSAPDMPVYTLLIGAIFLSGAAIVRPILYALGRRIFKDRVRAFDQRRVRRQSYECGLLLAALAALAALRSFTWGNVLLLTLVFTMAELLFLARIQAE
ncbi:hypothetical protein OSCT_1619 [Oscillochloris trichoides DG-6]|uniref:Uncharacterized protein n=1 Tax=Oscillochloris trichoides DG-6 TaxID=765420 RepID=E1IE68_9CHLR|nr:hypothetical protein [Oscillochloris trichoides]EFO80528.1 hypothetical protein OSCT_1619 [Oscillochloris trichoides DG-6]